MNSAALDLAPRPQTDSSAFTVIALDDVFPGDLHAQEALKSLRCSIETAVCEHPVFVLQFTSPPAAASLFQLVQFVDACRMTMAFQLAAARPAPSLDQGGTALRNYLIVAPELTGQTNAIHTRDGVVTALARQFNHDGFAYVASLQQKEMEDDQDGVRYLPLRSNLPSFGLMTAVIVIGDPAWVACAADAYPDADIFLLKLPQDRRQRSKPRLSSAGLSVAA